jgi:hypothetical protein
MNMKTVAKLSEDEAVLEDTMPFTESNIDRFSSLIEEDVTSAYRSITSSLDF